MAAALAWYLVISILGWLTFPLAYRMLPALSDRGFAFARTLGLLLWGYIFWMLASLGVARNDLGGLWLSFGLLCALSLWAGWGRLRRIGGWLRDHWKSVVCVEALFLAAFIFMAVVRAANPEIVGTEKPMELAFINAILHSSTFPPHDPWLSGYAISYYYFGYVMVAMLAKLTGVPGGVAFNLGISLVFALSAVGAFGMVYDLLGLTTIRAKARQVVNAGQQRFYAFLGPLFVLFISNAEGFLELLHARGFFWQRDATGQLSSSFWKWLDILDLNQPPPLPFTWAPTRFWWWWRASRVVQDYNASGGPLEIIDEFPVFSYILSDLHPHVLAMPFAFLAMALALNLFLGGFQGSFNWLRFRLSYRAHAWLGVFLCAAGIFLLTFGLSALSTVLTVAGLLALVAGGVLFMRIPREQRGSIPRLFTDASSGVGELGVVLNLAPAALLFCALILGGMAFLNTWDLPFYLALFAGAYILWRAFPEAPGYRTRLVELLKDFLSVGVVVGAVGILLYLPFYLGFSSQAGGIIPTVIYPTRGAQLWVMFATLLLPLLAYLAYLWRVAGGSTQLKKGFALAAGGVLLLWVLSWLLVFGILALPGVSDVYLNSYPVSATGSGEVIQTGLLRRITSPGGWITMLLVLTLVAGLYLPRRSAEARSETGASVLGREHLFGLLIILLGTCLVLGPDFFYLRDQFGYRINTIFKFYYEAWLLWAIAAAFGCAVLLLSLRRWWAVLFRVGLLAVLGVGLTYTVLGFWSKTNGFQPPQGWSLDGTLTLESGRPDDAAAIEWLNTAPPGTVAEAVNGCAYCEYARVATLSGQPDVLGWPNHESQWRGGVREMGSRQADLERLYCTNSWDEADLILQKYDIRYVFVGSLERETYVPNGGTCPAGLDEEKFQHYLSPVFQQGNTTIFAVPGS